MGGGKRETTPSKQVSPKDICSSLTKEKPDRGVGPGGYSSPPYHFWSRGGKIVQDPLNKALPTPW